MKESPFEMKIKNIPDRKENIEKNYSLAERHVYCSALDIFSRGETYRNTPDPLRSTLQRDYARFMVECFKRNKRNSRNRALWFWSCIKNHNQTTFAGLTGFCYIISGIRHKAFGARWRLSFYLIDGPLYKCQSSDAQSLVITSGARHYLLSRQGIGEPLSLIEPGL